MVNIHLRRMGKKKEPYYRLVVADSRAPRDGRFIDMIGSYDPRGKMVSKIDIDKYNAWVKKGAQPTKRVKIIIDFYLNDKLEGKVMKNNVIVEVKSTEDKMSKKAKVKAVEKSKVKAAEKTEEKVVEEPKVEATEKTKEKVVEEPKVEAAEKTEEKVVEEPKVETAEKTEEKATKENE